MIKNLDRKDFLDYLRNADPKNKIKYTPNDIWQTYLSEKRNQKLELILK